MLLRCATIGLAGLLIGCVAAPIPHTSAVTPELQGRIVDSATHAPVSGALVQLADRPKISAKSDADGQFALPRARDFYLLWVATYDGIIDHLPYGPVPSDTVRISHPMYVASEFSIRERFHPSDYYWQSTHWSSPKVTLPDISLDPVAR